jgi:murein L,D-transpeptidase YcbB/YkuD
LFKRAERSFSSGCIRIEEPVKLAEYVLQDDPAWTRERIISVLDGEEETTVQLPVSIPVYILYWTAWVKLDGIMNFRNDIYDRDQPVYEALREKPPR